MALPQLLCIHCIPFVKFKREIDGGSSAERACARDEICKEQKWSAWTHEQAKLRRETVPTPSIHPHLHLRPLAVPLCCHCAECLLKLSRVPAGKAKLAAAGDAQAFPPGYTSESECKLKERAFTLSLITFSCVTTLVYYVMNCMEIEDVRIWKSAEEFSSMHFDFHSARLTRSLEFPPDVGGFCKEKSKRAAAGVSGDQLVSYDGLTGPRCWAGEIGDYVREVLSQYPLPCLACCCLLCCVV